MHRRKRCFNEHSNAEKREDTSSSGKLTFCQLLTCHDSINTIFDAGEIPESIAESIEDLHSCTATTRRYIA